MVRDARLRRAPHHEILRPYSCQHEALRPHPEEARSAVSKDVARTLTRHGPIRGKFVIRVSRPICDDPLGITSRGDDGAATPAELRILRQGPAAECCGRADLFLRMHVLRR